MAAMEVAGGVGCAASGNVDRAAGKPQSRMWPSSRGRCSEGERSGSARHGKYGAILVGGAHDQIGGYK
jgi:hypothetical protein